MTEGTTENMDGGRSFEDRVFLRFDTLDASIRNLNERVLNLDSSVHDLDARVQKLEARSFDTKPIWERALNEIVETRRELSQTRRELSRRLDRIESVVLETRAGLDDAEERIEKLEEKPKP
jgi:chromosome segregation ATPase